MTFILVLDGSKFYKLYRTQHPELQVKSGITTASMQLMDALRSDVKSSLVDVMDDMEKNSEDYVFAGK